MLPLRKRRVDAAVRGMLSSLRGCEVGEHRKRAGERGGIPLEGSLKHRDGGFVAGSFNGKEAHTLLGNDRVSIANDRVSIAFSRSVRYCRAV